MKDPADVGPYTFEWDDWLTGAETITAATVDVDPGLVKLGEQISEDGRAVTVKLSGGTAGTAGTPVRVAVTCTVTTSSGNTWQDTKTITVRERKS